MWHRLLPFAKYAPSFNKMPGKQKKNMIKIRHTDYQLFAYEKREQSDFMEGIYCSRVQKSEIKFLYPKWSLLATVIS